MMRMNKNGNSGGNTGTRRLDLVIRAVLALLSVLAVLIILMIAGVL